LIFLKPAGMGGVSTAWSAVLGGRNVNAKVMVSASGADETSRTGRKLAAATQRLS
jgi:hypothetical protein